MISRRTFFGAAGVAAAGALAAPARILKIRPKSEAGPGKVRITGVKTASLNLKKYNTTLIKVTTDSGLYGLGEAYPKVDVAAHVSDIRDQIIGRDPLHVEVLTQMMVEKYISRGSLHGAYSGAVSGIEIALWDLAGKILKVPVYVLLGGAYREKVLLYHDSGSPDSADPGGWIVEVRKSLAHGFRAIKLSLPRYLGEKWNRTIPARNLKQWVRILEAVKADVGPDIPVGVDLHWKYNTRDALRFTGMIKDLDIWFLEDPLPPDNADAFARLTSASKVPILTGENLFTRYGFRPFIEKQACDMIHPDPQKCGGLLETKKIADWADLYNINMLCHNGCSPVGTIASAHACMAIKSFVALESDSIDLPYWKDIIQRSGPIFRNGYVEVPGKPGLGIELNEAVCRDHITKDSGFFD
jgi:L-alanine-DL-glutamate epimerase-like enolase superfamily enzyme